MSFKPEHHAEMTGHVRVLRRKGLSLRATARATGLCLDTVRRMDAPKLFQTVTRVEPGYAPVLISGRDPP